MRIILLCCSCAFLGGCTVTLEGYYQNPRGERFGAAVTLQKAAGAKATVLTHGD